MEKILHFIKYNNAAVIILALVLILGGGALAAGPEAIGQKQTSIQGVDNTALLAADFSAFNMDFKIENLEQDEQYYYVTYSFLDLVLADNAWQYQLSQRTQKVSKKIKEDIGVYLAKFLAKHYQARTRELKQEQKLAQSQGEQKRVEVTEYSGLVGRTLDLAAAVFPGYEPVVKRELPAPDFTTPLIKGDEGGLNPQASSGADNLTKIYNDYVAAHPEIFNPPAGAIDNAASSTPDIVAPLIKGEEGGLNGGAASSTPPATAPAADSGQASSSPDTVAPETPTDSTSSPSAIPEPTSVNIIELPVPAPVPAPAPESTPTPEPTPAP